MGPGQTQAIGGRMEPSVGADPKHVQQPTQKQQGGDRPLEEPSGDLKSGKEQRQGENKEEAGHYVKSTGVAAEGGDFDAAKPGAGKEADRLLEQAGLHRTEQGAASTKSDRGHEHGLHLPHHHHLHHHHDAETAVGTTGTGVGKSGGPAGNARMGATAESEGTKSDDGHEHGLHLPHRHHHHHHPHHHHLHLHLHHDTETAVGTRGSGVGKNGGPAGNAAAETEGKRGGFGEKIKKIHLPHME
ncbi:hypothetical protein BDZ91DRAFT_232949 [Kalaharituber pfeilii]|nr:hypothetical protein BDZ91DRAFT_232949 [Kalaharituber pfeilii]